jgi:transcriptional regulator with GAF, ATPase, and Fis domain
MTLGLASYQALTNSDAMRRLNGIIDRVAASDVTVLICGESGAGKEIVARAVHARSRRRDGPFVKVNCAALPLELLESELFGYERGAFTGAVHEKPGKFELAEAGTIFLDEIGEMPVALQAKLLQVLQDREFCRLGSRHDIRVDVRVVAASNRDLAREVKRGAFREDLFYRLNVVSIRVPPLRERREEIPVLVEHFLERYSQEHGCSSPRVSESTLQRLMQYDWPGNVRELENIVKRIVILGSEAVVDELQEVERPGALDAPLSTATGPGAAPADGLWPELGADTLGLKVVVRKAAEDAERRMLKSVLEQVCWRRVEAAQLLRISYKTLLEKIKYYELDRRAAETAQVPPRVSSDAR